MDMMLWINVYNARCDFVLFLRVLCFFISAYGGDGMDGDLIPIFGWFFMSVMIF